MDRPLGEKITDLISKNRMLRVKGHTYERLILIGMAPWNRSADSVINELIDNKMELDEIKKEAWINGRNGINK